MMKKFNGRLASFRLKKTIFGSKDTTVVNVTNLELMDSGNGKKVYNPENKCTVQL